MLSYGDASSLLRYVAISTALSLFAFLVVRILDTGILSIFAFLNGIKFNYSPFLVTFPALGQSGWTEGKVILIYTLPYLFFGLLGMYLPEFISRKRNWIFRLTITWLSFYMVILVGGALISGIFEFRQLGVAMTWLIPYIWLRILTVFVMITWLTFSSRRFCWYFLRAVPTRKFLKGISGMRTWLILGVVIPVLLSFILILPLVNSTLSLNIGASFLLAVLFSVVIIQTAPMVIRFSLKRRRNYF